MLAKETFYCSVGHLPHDQVETKKRKITRRSTTETESRDDQVSGDEVQTRNQREESDSGRSINLLEALPDDLVIVILSKLSSSAESRSDLVNLHLASKRLKELGLHPMVLSKASPKCYMVEAANWCESAHSFIKLCADAGNIEACYNLGMIRFYCLEDRVSGLTLIAKAAIVGSYTPALYSLALIQFNGSGGTSSWKKDKDLRAGISLFARAASFGHVDALRELGHCLQDGYGVPQNFAEGRRLIVLADARDLQLASSKLPKSSASASSRFMREWFEQPKEDNEGKRLCSQAECGRLETRPHEFRRCAVCAAVSYCSRTCQALDWKLRHERDCWAMNGWLDDDGSDDDVEDDDDEEGPLELY